MSTADPAVPTEQHESMGDRLKAAGRLAAKQAQRTKLTTVSLPSLYKSLGRHIYGRRAFAEDFPEIYQELERLAVQLKAMKATAADRPAAEGIAAKAKGAAMAAKEMAQSKGLEMQVNQGFTRLGQAAFEKHGEKSGPSELVAPIMDARSQLIALDAEITRLSSPSSARTFSAKRIAIGGGVLIALLLAIIAWKVLGKVVPGLGGPPTFTASELNAVFAEGGPYDRKVIRVSGRLCYNRYEHSIASTLMWLETNIPEKIVACTVEGKVQNGIDLAHLSLKGEEIVLEGRCQGRNNDKEVIVANCHLVSVGTYRPPPEAVPKKLDDKTAQDLASEMYLGMPPYEIYDIMLSTTGLETSLQEDTATEKGPGRAETYVQDGTTLTFIFARMQNGDHGLLGVKINGKVYPLRFRSQ